ncbi:low affinity iron permease family protein, partial [Phenylobacterium sp.]|uniref:low affinity iron permease family protein n=1 Tax=Phenylobacterium sp. TaxID=1871053 RepID=UPI002F3E9ABD
SANEPTETRFSLTKVFTGFANETSRTAGRPITFVICILLIAIWALTGPVFHYSDTWQLIINTSTTIVTFLMVFLIQNTQNRDGMAIQAKLDDLILTSDAENEFIGIEKLTDKELEALQARCHKAAQAHQKLVEHLEREKTSRRTIPADAEAPSAARRAAATKTAG